jgi:hypothetical protein
LSSKPGKIFALGPKPVYSERWVDTSGGFPTRNDFVSMEPFSGERFRYLVAAVPSIHTPIQISEERTVPCAKRQSLEEERESLLKDIVSRYSALIEKLRLAGALTMGEAHALANPNITFSAYVSKGCSKP